ncbi:exodeoxyribonuclease V subunit beta [Fodinibius halophilus]|uniref:DNA 3'-5' helicase n=1 Tax=Fodinibius halophilus TaxID=1736908 RepID=A0A6M1TAL0_9BACT|nr:exodeoxyribonuclease V subunit beta [Fodinibius halophilus]NGP88014.1 exodeoxyribonuclease V subunit beta [Fodinibius halophilus]
MKLLKPFEVTFSGINLVEASAGTGKTYNITSLYIRALIEQDISVGKILVVTYTEAATKELKDRLLDRIRESIAVLKAGEVEDESDQFLTELLGQVIDRQQAITKLEQAVRMFDEASVYTIHGFCYQALQEQAFESGAMYDAEMIGDDSELVQEAVDDYWRSWVAEVSENPQKEPLLKLLDDKGLGPESLASELGTYIGKPYLEILPKEIDDAGLERELQQFSELHGEMKAIWEDQRSVILELLSRDEMSNYRSDWLTSWFASMDAIFESETPSINIFDKFERFTQSYIDGSLKKSAEKEGVRPPQHPFFKLADNYQEQARTFKQYDIIFKKKLLAYLRNELNKKKEELQVLSYDDLLLRLRNALLDEERGKTLAAKLREKYPIAMVDEFQDTDPNQYDIFRRIYKDTNETLFMIGDPKQSIYSFRGADVYSYIEAREDAPQENRFRLDRNFRSTPDLLRGLNAFWGGHENPFVVGDDIEYKQVEWGWPEKKYDRLKEYGRARPPIRFRRLSETGQDQLTKEAAKEQVAEDTADEIYRLLEGGKKGDVTIGDRPLQAKDIAVLVRRHKQADLISEALQERDIKSVRHSNQSVFESEEAAQLTQLLKAVAEPTNETLVKTALALSLTNYTARELYTIEEDEEQWVQVLQQFADWHQRWQQEGFAAMYRSLLSRLKVAEHSIKYPDGERRLTNLLHLGELLQEESQHHKEGTRSLLHWLVRKRKENSSNHSDEEQLRLESDEELVKIVTMHKSKGLQYPVVFCPFLWYGPRISDSGQPLVYHRPDDTETTYLDLHGKSDDDRAEKRFYTQREEQAESLRLAYVAMTRAQQCVYLTWQFANDAEFSSLGYLLQDPQQAEALLKKKVKYGPKVEWSGDQMHHKIEKLCTRHPQLFTLKQEPEVTQSPQLEFPGFDDTQPELKARSFDRNQPLTTSYRVSSFSSLTSIAGEDDPDMPDYDQYIDEPVVELPQQQEEKNIFTFPKGPQPGTCIHNIFEDEDTDFAQPGEAGPVIRKNLQSFGIDTDWEGVVTTMLETVVNKPLLESDDSLCLSALDTKQMIPEMEFYYQNDQIEAEKLISIIRPNDRPTGGRGRAESGYLKGFIDLTFEFDGKYYLLDYKTNYLGDSVSDYRGELLKEEMQEASYDLQYHIYTVALHRFLKARTPDYYSYEQHFGGAFYLFLRGMNEQGREGIFFDKPERSTITHLNEYILGGRHE